MSSIRSLTRNMENAYLRVFFCVPYFDFTKSSRSPGFQNESLWLGLSFLLKRLLFPVNVRPSSVDKPLVMGIRSQLWRDRLFFIL